MRARYHGYIKGNSATSQKTFMTPEFSRLTKDEMSALHDILDLAGIANPAADVLNGMMYLGEGDFKNAAISIAAIIPGSEDAVGVAKIAVNGGKYIDVGKEIILKRKKSYDSARNILIKELDKTGRFKNGSRANFGRLESSYGYRGKNWTCVVR